MQNIKKEIQEQLIRNSSYGDLSDEDLMDKLDDLLTEKSRICYISIRDRKKFKKEIFNSIRRLDILQELLEDPEITEIMVNGAEHIFIEKYGALFRWEGGFESKKKLEDIIQQMVAGCNRVINETTPIVDARLEDGSRVNVVLPPIALNGPIITIRKFPEKPITMEALIGLGALSEEIASFLRLLVISGYSIFVSGGTGSGKTTFLNALSNYIPSDERIITIEDSAELQIYNIPNLVRLEVRNANVEGKNEITIRDLIKSSLRMRPSRIIIGEIRDAACIDLLQCLNTGHCGMSTGHANSTKDMLSRMETMVLLGADIPLLAVRKQIASAIDLIIHLGRLRDRSRKVLEIAEILDCLDGEIRINPIYHFCETGIGEGGKVLGHLERTINPLIGTAKLKSAGFHLDINCISEV